MKARLWRLLKKSATLAAWLFTVVFSLYLFCFDGLADLVIGRMHRVANLQIMGPFYRAGEIDEVHIYLLSGKASQATAQTFPLRREAYNPPIYGEYILTGAKLGKFLELWTDQAPAYAAGGMCHEPVYGFRLYSHGKLRTETALCWHCSNFSFSGFPYGGAEYGFDAHGMSGMQLLAFCDKLLPYPREEDASPSESQDSWALTQETPIDKAIMAFNDHYHKRLVNDQDEPLMRAEILSALALAASSSPVGVSSPWKERCEAHYQKRVLPQRAKFTLVTDAEIGPSGAKNDYLVSYITLTLGGEPETAPTDALQRPKEDAIQHAITLPVRLIKREFKPWLRREK